MMTDNDNNIQEQPKHRSMEKMSYAEKGRFFAIRNILNIIFIILAIVGMALFFYTSREIGGIVLIIAVFIKMVESVLRILH